MYLCGEFVNCDIMEKFFYKYQQQLEALEAVGFSMPNVVTPDNLSASRYVFSDSPERNHLPVCVSNPKRVLPGPIKTSGYALSCFGDVTKAISRYNALKSTFKQIQQTLGDSLAEGVLSKDDGRVTPQDAATSHFDLYESKDCDLSKTFSITTEL